MRRARRLEMAVGLVLVLVASPTRAQGQQWTFADVERLEVEGVSGDVELRAAEGSELTVTLWKDVTPSDAFDAAVRSEGGTVRLLEEWRGGESTGNVRWSIGIPAGSVPIVRIRTSSGDLDLEGVQARLEFRSSSGDVDLRRATLAPGSSFTTSSGDYRLHDAVLGDDVSLETSSGDFELVQVTAGRNLRARTSSGDVLLEASRGVPRVESSSGDVRVTDIELSEASRFSSSSGDVFVRLSAPATYDLDVRSSSGHVRLDPGALGESFRMVLTKREDRGRIDVPFAFTSEDVFVRNGQPYVEKIVEKGAGQPLIRLQTASGSISVAE